MEARAVARFQRYGARKVAQVLGQLRGKSLWQAEQMLPALPRAAAGMVAKTVRSAAANLNMSAGRKVDPKTVRIARCWVDRGPTRHLQRVMPAPMGRAMTFRRKTCHVTVVVESEG